MGNAAELVAEPKRDADGTDRNARQGDSQHPCDRKPATGRLAFDAVCTERPCQLITCRIHYDRNPPSRNEDGSGTPPTDGTAPPESGATIMASAGEGSSWHAE